MKCSKCNGFIVVDISRRIKSLRCVNCGKYTYPDIEPPKAGINSKCCVCSQDFISLRKGTKYCNNRCSNSVATKLAKGTRREHRKVKA